MQGRYFVGDSVFSGSKIEASSLQIKHDASSPDSALILNYQWRVLLSDLLLKLDDKSLYTGTDIEIDTALDNVQSLISGLYADIPQGTPMSESIGDLKIIPHNGIPSNWMVCDGAEISRITYSELFNLIGSIYGNGNGSSTFNLPDLRGRTIIGVGQGVDLTNRNIGDNVGTERHTLVVGQIPEHTHTTVYSINANPGNNNAIIRANVTQGTGTATVNNVAGGGNSHPNMQPSIALNYIIKVSD